MGPVGRKRPVAMPEAPSSVLAPSSKARSPVRSFLLLFMSYVHIACDCSMGYANQDSFGLGLAVFVRAHLPFDEMYPNGTLALINRFICRHRPFGSLIIYSEKKN